MGLDLDVESVITDFELNIQKAVDDLLPNAKNSWLFLSLQKGNILKGSEEGYV